MPPYTPYTLIPLITPYNPLRGVVFDDREEVAFDDKGEFVFDDKVVEHYYDSDVL